MAIITQNDIYAKSIILTYNLCLSEYNTKALEVIDGNTSDTIKQLVQPIDDCYEHTLDHA